MLPGRGSVSITGSLGISPEETTLLQNMVEVVWITIEWCRFPDVLGKRSVDEHGDRRRQVQLLGRYGQTCSRGFRSVEVPRSCASTTGPDIGCTFCARVTG